MSYVMQILNSLMMISAVFLMLSRSATSAGRIFEVLDEQASIAHRLSTVRNAKAIIVLENGSILERGSQEELVAEKGRYYHLYTGKFELD